MIIIMTGNLGITSITMMTDAVEDDLIGANDKHIDYDDVLEVHKFLKNLKS